MSSSSSLSLDVHHWGLVARHLDNVLDVFALSRTSKRMFDELVYQVPKHSIATDPPVRGSQPGLLLRWDRPLLPTHRSSDGGDCGDCGDGGGDGQRAKRPKKEQRRSGGSSHRRTPALPVDTASRRHQHYQQPSASTSGSTLPQAWVRSEEEEDSQPAKSIRSHPHAGGDPRLLAPWPEAAYPLFDRTTDMNDIVFNRQRLFAYAWIGLWINPCAMTEAELAWLAADPRCSSSVRFYPLWPDRRLHMYIGCACVALGTVSESTLSSMIPNLCSKHILCDTADTPTVAAAAALGALPVHANELQLWPHVDTRESNAMLDMMARCTSVTRVTLQQASARALELLHCVLRSRVRLGLPPIQQLSLRSNPLFQTLRPPRTVSNLGNVQTLRVLAAGVEEVSNIYDVEKLELAADSLRRVAQLTNVRMVTLSVRRRMDLGCLRGVQRVVLNFVHTDADVDMDLSLDLQPLAQAQHVTLSSGASITNETLGPLACVPSVRLTNLQGLTSVNALVDVEELHLSACDYVVSVPNLPRCRHLSATDTQLLPLLRRAGRTLASEEEMFPHLEHLVLTRAERMTWPSHTHVDLTPLQRLRKLQSLTVRVEFCSENYAGLESLVPTLRSLKLYASHAKLLTPAHAHLTSLNVSDLVYTLDVSLLPALRHLTVSGAHSLVVSLVMAAPMADPPVVKGVAAHRHLQRVSCSRVLLMDEAGELEGKQGGRGGGDDENGMHETGDERTGHTHHDACVDDDDDDDDDDGKGDARDEQEEPGERAVGLNEDNDGSGGGDDGGSVGANCGKQRRRGSNRNEVVLDGLAEAKLCNVQGRVSLVNTRKVELTACSKLRLNRVHNVRECTLSDCDLSICEDLSFSNVHTLHLNKSKPSDFACLSQVHRVVVDTKQELLAGTCERLADTIGPGTRMVKVTAASKRVYEPHRPRLTVCAHDAAGDNDLKTRLRARARDYREETAP
ncbi:hypothetical protein PTSG_06898 [Salpingoeca rosetta]|uniref:Uncharacterized protein n=1 Tax=Salpingoeca rosetta (strain ATCC 50818 / BSB-021) TaxID=946362 RepID=F2UF44_SALR5|nr:uncharacterized protein PTSG_06898 [Salpingoeca rosetta]EGD75244.1 hypothetical protein PTSG_06898 [Salpingoeca rosetta]|eukprot:XP_004992297.1 hypothetical protein PTSG_06898 [Salpingoeca rosetta]